MYGAERRVLVVPLHQQRDALLALLESEDRDACRLQRRDRRADRRERRQRAPDGRYARDLTAARARDTRDLPALLHMGHDERADAPLLARAHLDGHAVPCRQRDRTVMEHLRAVRGEAEHLVAGDGGEPPRRRAHARIGGINAVHVRINDTALRAEKGRERHGARVAAAAPERGDNAIYKMADILQEVRALNENGDGPSNEIKGLVKMLDPKYNPEHWEDARFLGRGTCTTSQIFFTSPSRCAVADSCSISIDRRMTAGETYQSCLKEIEDLPACKKYANDIKVSMYMYDRPSWTGHVYETEAFFPTWINKETAPHVQALVDAHHALWGTERIGADEKAMSTRTGRPLTDKWTFSTNGVSIQGRYGIPCVGFGPGAESQAHAPNEITWKQDLVTCAALYAAVPGLYKPENKDGSATSFRQELTGNNIK